MAEYDTKLTVAVPTNLKSALEKTAYSRSTPHEKVTASDITREGVREWLARQDELPEEVLDDLDEDLIANAGGQEES